MKIVDAALSGDLSDADSLLKRVPAASENHISPEN